MTPERLYVLSLRLARLHHNINHLLEGNKGATPDQVTTLAVLAHSTAELIQQELDRQQEKTMSKDRRREAKRMLSGYFETCFNFMGVVFRGDNRTEVEQIVDLIFDEIEERTDPRKDPAYQAFLPGEE